MKKSDSSPIHVMQVLHTLEIGGAEKLAYDIARNFKPGFRFSFFCLDGLGELSDRIKAEGGEVYCFGRKGGWDFALIKRFAQLMTDIKVDVVQAHQYTPYFYTVMAALYSKRHPRVIFTEHGRHQPDKVRGKRVVFNTLMRPFTAKYTGVAQFSKDSLVQFEKIPAHRIDVIYNGIDLSRFPKQYSQSEKRKQLGLPLDRTLIGIIARFDPIKDHKSLIDAIALLLNKVPDTQLLIVGDGPIRQELEDQVAQLKLSDSVRFLGMRSDVPDILMALDVFVLPSIMEATSVTLLEAMAASTPVVATRAGGNKEVVVDGTTGLLVPVSQPPALADALATLLTDRSTADAMGKAARKRVEDNFTFEMMIDKHEHMYRELAQR